MTNPHGRRIQARRATAILAWGALVLLALLLRYARVEGLIRSQVWEPAAMILSAFIGFLSLFCWLLFSPQRGTIQEESPAVFFAGILTLIPPGFIAWYLMPPASPLRAWVALGVVIFGVLAILSPIPEALFRIPRDRRSYLRPVTDATLSLLDVDAPQARFDDLVPRTQFRLTGQAPDEERGPMRDDARDPWLDPFRGTGRQLSRVLPVESRGRKSLTEETRAGRDAVPISRLVAEQFPLGSGSVDESGKSDARLASVGSRGVNESIADSATVERGDRTQVGPGAVLPRDKRAELQAEPGDAGRLERRPLRDPESPTSPALRGNGEPGSTGRNVETLRGQESVAEGRAGLPSGPASGTAVTAAMAATGAITAAAGIGFGMASAGAARAASLVKSVVRRSEGAATGTSAKATAIASPAVGASISRPDPGIQATVPATESESLRPESAAVSPTLRELDRMLRDEFHEVSDESELAEGSGNQKGEAVDDDDSVSESVASDTIRLERTTDEFGGEMIEGAAIAKFAIGQKRVNLHIPLSPPLAGVPVVECEQAGDESLRLRVPVRQPYGFRIEARRTEASTMLEAEVLFSAVYTPTHRP
jgi:hypothetical protein